MQELNYRFIRSFKATTPILIKDKKKLLNFLQKSIDSTMCEYLDENMITKSYFYCEKEYDLDSRPTDREMIKHLNNYIKLITEFFEINKSDIAVSHRHGEFMKEKKRQR